MRHVFIKCIIILSIFLLPASCEVSVIEVTEIEFFLAKEWRIVEYSRSGEVQTNEILAADNRGILENYRLNLKDDFTFTRVDLMGEEDSGTWSLVSGLTQLILDSPEPDKPRRWLIVDLEVRRLELDIITGELPGGRLAGQESVTNAQEKFILEPVPGQ